MAILSDSILGSSSITTLVSGTSFPPLPGYVGSYSVVDSSNLDVLVEGPEYPPLPGFYWSYSLINASSLDVLVEGQKFTLEPFIQSNNILGQISIEVLAQAPPIYLELERSYIRQIYTDENYIYAATSRGLAVFSR